MFRFTRLLPLLLILACAKTVDPTELFTKAETYYKDRKLVEALDHFQQFVSAFPDHESADRSSFMIAFIFANDLRDTLKAREAYTTFLSDFPAADAGLRASAEWELEHMGEDVSQLEFLDEPK
jgi:outer membrane protein assembly factor BamD (BamD/ComL family)